MEILLLHTVVGHENVNHKIEKTSLKKVKTSTKMSFPSMSFGTLFFFFAFLCQDKVKFDAELKIKSFFWNVGLVSASTTPSEMKPTFSFF